MLVEKIIFSILAFYLFIVMFFKMIKKIDSAYIAILVIQALGIAISFVEIIFRLNYNIFIKILAYILSIVIPIIIMYMEHQGKNFSELILIALAKFYTFIRKYKEEQRYIISTNR